MLVTDAVDAVRSYVAGRVVPPRRRRAWQRAGRAHIEVRGAHLPEAHELREAVTQALRAVEGVDWAELNAAIGYAVVAFDEQAVGVGALVSAIEETERAFGMTARHAPPSVEHPGDPGAGRFGALEIAADVAGIALGIGTRFVRLPALPIEIAAAVPAVDSLPSVRRVLEARRGLEAAVVSTGAVLQGLGHGPVGLVVDATHRVVLLREAVARRAAWDRFEATLHAEPRGARAQTLARPPRPEPVPEGMVERYARRVSFASLGAAGAALAVTRNPRAAADILLAAVPRPARVGRDAFAAQTTCVLAAHDVVVMDPRVMRRLDRVDTVVVEADVLARAGNAAPVLVDAIRDAAQDLVVATSAGAAPTEAGAGAQLRVAGGPALLASVRALQADGRVVAVVSNGHGAALAAADCGIGVLMPAGAPAPPWGAHLLCPNVYTAALVVDATSLARTASRDAIGLAAGGSATAALFALVPGRRPGTVVRCSP